jgi:hypothetical protein
VVYANALWFDARNRRLGCALLRIERRSLREQSLPLMSAQPFARKTPQGENGHA